MVVHVTTKIANSYLWQSAW